MIVKVNTLENERRLLIVLNCLIHVNLGIRKQSMVVVCKSLKKKNIN